MANRLSTDQSTALVTAIRYRTWVKLSPHSVVLPSLITPMVTTKYYTVWEILRYLILITNCSIGIYAPRVSSNGSDLSSARLISLVAFNGTSVPQPNFTLAIMQFGQFMNHDMELTNQVSFGNETLTDVLKIRYIIDDKFKF